MYLRVGTALSLIAVLAAAPVIGAAQESPSADGSGGLGDWILRRGEAEAAARTADLSDAGMTGAVGGAADGGTAGSGAASARPGATSGRAGPAVPAGQRSLSDDPMAEPGPEAREASLGLRGPGNLVWRPEVEARGGWTSNTAGKAGGRGGAVYTIAPQVTARSDWSRHAFETTLRGSYSAYPSDSSQSAPSFDGSARLRLDLADGWQGDAALRASYSRGSASSAENPADTVIPSTAVTRGASLGLTRDAGLVGLTLRGDVDRVTYTGGQTTGGGAITSDRARDNTRLALALRTSLSSGAAIQPYVEAQAIHRVYDQKDPTDRGSTGYAGIVGATLDFGPLLKGEVSTGWTHETPRADNLPALQGLMFDGNLVWSPTRLARVTATAKTTFESTTLDGSSGAVTHQGGLVASLDLTRDVSLETGVQASRKDYSGISRREDTVGAHAEVGWWLRPEFQLFARGEWSRFTANGPGEDYGTVTVLTGVRVRR